MRVPDAAGNGKAKVTLSFPDWKEGSVAPATFEVPIGPPEPRSRGNDPKSRLLGVTDLLPTAWGADPDATPLAKTFGSDSRTEPGKL